MTTEFLSDLIRALASNEARVVWEFLNFSMRSLTAEVAPADFNEAAAKSARRPRRAAKNMM